MQLQTCRRHPGHLFALSCPGCRQDTHDKQYPEYATRAPQQHTPAGLRLAAVTAVGVAVITAPAQVLDPSIAYRLQTIDDLRPRITNLEAQLNRRLWRMDDIGMSLRWQLDRDRQALHIAEEWLLDLYGATRRPAVTVAYSDDTTEQHADDPDYDQCPGCAHWWPLADMCHDRNGDNVCSDCIWSWSTHPDHR